MDGKGKICFVCGNPISTNVIMKLAYTNDFTGLSICPVCQHKAYETATKSIRETEMIKPKVR